MSEDSSVFNEFKNLCNIPEKGQDPAQKEGLMSLLEKVETIYLQISRLDVNSLGSLAEAFAIMDTTSQTLDRIWTDCTIYSSDQVLKLMNCISSDLCKFIIASVASYKLFDNTKPSRTLHLCSQLLAKWYNQAILFTSTQWPQFTPRPWNGGTYKNPDLAQLYQRVNFFAEFRKSFFYCAQFKQNFMPPNIQNIGGHIELSEDKWNEITTFLMGHLKSLLFGDGGVIDNVNAQLKSVSDSQDALASLIQSFTFLKNFDEFNKVVQPYEATRDKLFLTFLDLIKGQLPQHESNDPTDTVGTIWILHQIQYCHDFMAKIQEPTKEVTEECQSIIQLFEKSIEKSFLAWCKALNQKLNDVDFTKPLFTYEFNPNSKLATVTFPEEYSNIIEQSANLTALKKRIPNELQNKIRRVLEQKGYYCQIRQVCDYYNSTIIQMIRPLRRLLIQYIDQFINSFQSIVSADFTFPDTVEQFIANILKQAKDLDYNNNQMLQTHKKFIADISGLFECSLVSGQDKWKETLRVTRNQIIEIYKNGLTNVKPWMKHLQSQVYKALDYQFDQTLSSMETEFQKITVNISYNVDSRSIVFEPTLGNLRSQLYAQITNVISIPSRFQGINLSNKNESVNEFIEIYHSHTDAIERVYQRTEKLLDAINGCTKQLNTWIALGTITDFDARISSMFSTPEEFRTNLNFVSIRESEIEQLPDTQQFEFITVNYQLAKASFRKLVSEYKRAICNFLRKSLDNDISTVMDFINNSLASVQTSVQTSEEVRKSRENIVALSKMVNDYSKTFQSIRSKSSLLMIHDQQSRQSLQFQIDSIQSHWEIFRGTLQDQNKVITQQMRTLKTLMSQKIDDFQRRTTSFKLKWEERKPKNVDFRNDAAVKKAIATVKETKNGLEEFKKERDMLLAEEASFGVKQERQFPDIKEVSQQLKAFESTWLLVDKWQTALDELSSEDWITFRSHIFDLEEFLQQWEQTVNSVPQSEVSNYVLDQVHSLLKAYPSFKYVRGENWVAEHWEELGIIIKYPKPMKINELKLKDIISSAEPIRANIHKIKQLCERAKGEGTIRSALREIREWNMHTEFVLFEQHGVPVIKEWKDLLTQVSDMQATIQSLSSLQFAEAFESEIQLWTTKFTTLHEALLLLNQIQRKWLHLAPIFSSGALPSHTEKFNALDNQFKSIMNDTKKDPQVTSLLNKYDIVSTLKGLLEGLDACQSALTAFLESKRQGFPRLYFIGDFDLLDILGKVRETPDVVQTHLKNLFQGISSVEFDEDKKLIAFCSSLGEKIYLPEPVYTTSSVEVWLNELCVKAQKALMQLLSDYMDGDAFTTKKFPSQIVQVGESIKYTSDMVSAIPQRALRDCLKGYQQKLIKVAEFRKKPLEVADLNSSIKVETTEDSEISLIKCLIIDLVQFTSVMEELQRYDVNSLDNFQWLRRIKYFFENDKCVIRMCDGTFDYGYEYQGNAPKLVHTPLTDICWSTLCEGMHLGFAGNPYGPAGTGKTESVKALGQAMGRQVLVFNCGDGIDVKSICRIFTGLVQCGAWGCFDEFNRLDELVLSAVSQQIQAIQTAILKRKETVTLLGKTVSLDLKSGIFVTLNPAGKAYGGRSKLPNNLKALFRSVSMSAPDKALIGEIMLYSEGFQNSTELAQRLTTTFSLADQLLSKQRHYDWGLRAQKTVLNMAGQWLRESDGNQNESDIVIRALLFDTLGKLDDKDRALFLDIVKDIFKTKDADASNENSLQETINEIIKEKKLQPSQQQLTKIALLHQLLQHRTGAVIVGPAGCGKSTVWRVLADALTKSGHKCNVWHIVPKSDSLEMLMGSIDLDTREWTDGALTRAARAAAKLPPEEFGFIVCDGDVDPVWIESLNSVLDDNKLLTLPTGERIQFDKNVKFIFETHSLQFASPATVSRMGVLFVNAVDFDVQLTFPEFVSSMKPEVQKLFTKFIPQVLSLLQQNAQNMVFPLTDLSMVRNIYPHVKNATCETDFILGVIRGSVSMLSPSAQEKFAQLILQNAKSSGIKVSMKNPLTSQFNEKDGSVSTFDYIKLGENQWDVTNPPFIKTPESMRFLVTAEAHKNENQPLLIVGPKGCGKTTLIQQLYPGDVEVINCNALTNAKVVINRLTELCSSSPGANGIRMKPRSGKPLTLFFKGIQYPAADKFETVQLHSFIRQLTQLNGFMNDSLEWVELVGISIVASMNPGETLQAISERLISQFRIVVIDYISSESLKFIYGEYVTKILHTETESTWNNSNLCYELAKAIVAVYDNFLSTNGFTPKDVTKWVTGISRYQDNNPNEILLFEAQRLFSDRLQPAKRKEFEGVLSKNISGKVMVFSSFGFDDHFLHRVSASEVKKQLQTALTTYEREIGPLDISLVNYTAKFAMQINRALALPKSHVMFIANTGTSTKEVLRLVAHCMKGKVYTPAIFDGYSIRHFTNDLKACLNGSAFDKNMSVFCMEEYQLLDPSFYEYINSLLAGVFPSNLYTAEEIKAILSQLEDISFEEFKKLVFENFRFAFIIDPRSSGYQTIIKSQPMFSEACSVLSVGELSENILNDMTPMIVSKLEAPEETAKIPFGNIAKTLEMPTSDFQSFISNFNELSKKKSDSLSKRKQFLSDGLLRLNAVASKVNQLSKEADAQRAQVEEKEKRANEAMNEISKTMTELTKQQDQMDVIQQDLTRKEGELSAQREEIDKQLADIKPTLQAASEKVSQIRPEHLSEIKSFTAPPPLVRDVLTGVVLLLGNQNTSWAGIKQAISNSGFLMSILKFDPHNVTNKMINDVENFIKTHMGSFDREQAERSSAAAAPLSQWVKAMVKYCAVIQRVQPLENKMKELDDQLVSSRNQLKDLEQKKVTLNQRVIEMQEQFKQYTAEAEHLRISLTELEERTKAASSLLNKLGDEQKRWAQQVKDIEKEVSMIQPRLILSAAFMTSCGSMNETERSNMMKKLTEKLELKEQFSFTPFMNTQSEILEMKHNGFPSDDLSVENAQIIVNSGQRTLFIIDPTEHVVEWLQNVLGPSAEVLSSSHPRFQHQVTLAIRFGKKLIIREADKVPLCLYPFLNKEFVMSNGHLTVAVGDKFIDVHQDFRLIIVTRDAAIKLTPRERSLVSLVNFTVTKTALKAQLLTLALTTELPELEEKHQEQLNESEQLKIELGKLEEGLLEILGKANPDTILQNKELIKSLDDKKKRAVDVESRLAQVEEFQKQIEEKRSQYQMLADVSSSIYFAIENLHLVHPMYKFSLNEFTKLFVSTFTACQEKEKRVKNLILTFNSMAYSHFSRALFREHRLVFGMQLLKTVYPKMFPEPEYQHLLRPKSVSGLDGVPAFVPAERKPSVASLHAAFPDLTAKLQFAQNDRAWQGWLQSASPEMNSEWPTIDGKTIQELGVTQLQKILILQAIRPDRVITALEKLVISTFKNPRILSLREVMTEETDNTFIFIVTPGSDPSIELKEIAMEIETVGENNFIELALGECDSQEALSLVKSAARSGQWAVIKNVHLDIEFLQQLEKTLPSLAPKDGFKLILTTEATTSFPNVLLQSSAKIAYEAPPGLVNQMKRTLTLWNDDWFEKQPKKVRQALVSLAHLHGTLQERRAFIPVGWSQFFEFTQADLNAASQIIVQRVSSTDVVRGLIEMTVYGGPMDSPFDRRVLSKFIERAFPAKSNSLFSIPEEPHLNEIHEILTKTNSEDGPALLELAPNANATIARSTLVNSLKFLGVLSAASGGDESRANDHFQQVEELSKEFPSALEDASVNLNNHPAIDFLTIQRAAAHKLAKIVKDDLQALSGAVDTSLLPAHLRAVSGALQTNKVPQDWDVDWLHSEEISEWLEELFHATAAVDQCAMRLTSHNILTSQPVPLRATIRPAAFVMALMQTAARMNDAEMDKMMLVATFDSPPQNSLLTINVCDISAQVAIVQGNRITLSKSPNNDVEKVDRFFLSVMPKDNHAQGILVPVFESINRDRLVCKVLTPCNEAEKDALVLSSAAFVLTSF